jgi:hypothetical protein
MTEVVQHQALSDGPKPFEGSGKDVYKPHVAPIQSINPTSEEQGNKANAPQDTSKFITVAKANTKITHADKPSGVMSYPFNDLEVGGGLYIPVEQNSTTDKLMEKLYREVANARMAFAEIERDEKGDEIWDCVIVKTRLKNDDGTFQMGAYGKPLEGANQTIVPRYVYDRHYAVKAVVKDDDLGEGQKAPHDGALVVRVG